MGKAKIYQYTAGGTTNIWGNKIIKSKWQGNYSSNSAYFSTSFSASAQISYVSVKPNTTYSLTISSGNGNHAVGGLITSATFPTAAFYCSTTIVQDADLRTQGRTWNFTTGPNDTFFVINRTSLTIYLYETNISQWAVADKFNIRNTIWGKGIIHQAFDNSWEERGIYGVSWDGSGKTLTRTDDALSFSDPVPYHSGMSASACSSPFDTLLPWSGMEKSTDALGNAIVSIPKFWYKISTSPFKIQIANYAATGFSVSPAHRARNGETEKDVVYIGRYHSNSSYKSTSGQTPISSISIGTARNNTRNLGGRYQLMDYSMWMTIWMLYLVEFANWDAPAKIGYGGGNGSSKGSTGASDSMPYHTGTMQSTITTWGLGVQYRWIEDLWGNVFDWCDGITYNGATVYAFTDFANYGNAYNGTGATQVLTRPTSDGYIQTMNVSSVSGFDWLMYPGSVGSSSTKIPDDCYYGASAKTLSVGQDYERLTNYGLFCIDGSYTATDTNAIVGCRLQYIPS